MKKKILLPILLLAAMSITGCGKQPVSSSEPGGDVSSQEPASTEEPVSSEDPTVYGVAIANKAALQDGWYAGTNRDLDVTLTPAANALQELGKGNLRVTSSNAEVVKVSGLGLAALKEGTAKITVEYHNAKDEVEVTILDPSAKGKYGAAHEGTAEDPFTNEDALLVAKHEKYEGEVYYVKGKVASFYNAPGSRTDGMVAYFLEPATAGGEKFEIYKCFKEDGSPLTDDDIWVGGEATAYGAFTLYGTQYETSSAKFVKCEGNKPQPRTTLSKTFAETLAMGQALPDGGDTYDYIKFTGFVTARSGNNYWLTATKGEALIAGKSDAAHGERDIYTNAIELYNAGKVEALVAKLLEGAEVEVTMLVKNYHGTVENGLDLKDEDVTLKTPGTAWSVPEPAVENKTIAEFKALQNTKAKAYNVTGTIKNFKNGATKDAYGNMTLKDGDDELIIYGATMTATALAWDNAGAYAFTNPKDFMSNETSNALAIGTVITMKLVRNDYTSGGNTTIEGVGVIVNIQAVAATGIELDKSELEVEEGATAQLVASILPAGATGVVTWESSAEAVATVSANGVVLGVAAGTATITAKLGEFSATCAVTVKASSVVTNLERATSIAVGDRLVLACDNGTVKKQFNGIVAAGSNKIGEAVDYTGAVPAEDKAIIEVVAGKNEGTFGFKLDDKYICWTSGNTLNVQDAIDENSSWTVTFADGNATIANVKDSARKLQYNAGSPRFCAYTSAQTPVQLWKFKGSVTPVENEAMPWYTEGTGNQAIHFEGAGIWTWVKYDSMGFENFAAFDAAKANFVATYESEPAATIVEKVVSDDNATLKYARVYIVLSAAYNTGKLTLTIPGADGKTYEGTLEFAAGELSKINGEAVAAPVAQPVGAFRGLAKTAAATFIPVDLVLAADSAALSVNGEAANVTSYNWDNKDTLTIVTDGAYGTVTAKFAENVFQITGLTGAAAAQLDLSFTVQLSGNCQFIDAGAMTLDQMNATFVRRYDRNDGNGWQINNPSDGRISAVTVAGRAGLQCNGFSSGKVGFTLKNDLSTPIPGTVIKSVGCWIYNPGESAITMKLFAYKSANRASNGQLNTFTVEPGWHFYQSGVVNGSSFTSSDSFYNFQFFYENVSVNPVFDDLCIYM